MSRRFPNAAKIGLLAGSFLLLLIVGTTPPMAATIGKFKVGVTSAEKEFFCFYYDYAASCDAYDEPESVFKDWTAPSLGRLSVTAAGPGLYGVLRFEISRSRVAARINTLMEARPFTGDGTAALFCQGGCQAIACSHGMEVLAGYGSRTTRILIGPEATSRLKWKQHHLRKDSSRTFARGYRLHADGTVGRLGRSASQKGLEAR